jgi:hypothetical protein
MVNGVDVGVIRDSRLAELWLAVVGDRRTYALQLLNVLRAAGTAAGLTLLLLPTLAFWVAVIVAVAVPAEFVAAIQQFVALDAAQRVDAIPRLVATASLYCLQVVDLPGAVDWGATLPSAMGLRSVQLRTASSRSPLRGAMRHSTLTDRAVAIDAPRRVGTSCRICRDIGPRRCVRSPRAASADTSTTTSTRAT